MSSGVNLKLLADTSSLIKGTRDSATALDQVVDSLEELALESRTTGDKLETDLKGIARDGETAADKLERSMRDAFDTVKKESRETARKVERDSDDGFGAAGAVTGEFKDEARSNFSEITSSFTGDMDSIADLAQGTLGGLAGSLAGPFGIAAGTVAAAGGLFYAKWKESTERTKQRVADMYDDLIDSGERFLSESYKQDSYWAILKDDEGAVLSLDKANEYAKLLGISVQEVALAWAGNDTQMRQVIDGLKAKRQEYVDQLKGASEEERTQLAETIGWYDAAIAKNQDRNDEIDETVDAVNRSRAAWDVYGSEAGQVLADQQRDYGKVRDAASRANDAIRGIPPKTTVEIDAVINRRALFASIQGALDDTQFTAYAKARTQYGTGVS